MESDVDPLEQRKADTLIKSLMAQNAFWGRQIDDARTFAILQQNGLLQKVKADPLPERVVLILENPDHPDRFSLPAGPMVWCQDDAATNTRVFLEVREHLFSSSRRVREAAYSHFERYCTPDQDVLVERTKTVMSASKDGLYSDDPDRWRRAAIAIADAIADDFLCNLAGLGQALQMRLEQTPYLPKILRPSVSSLSALVLPIAKPTEQVEKITMLVEECVKTERLAEACSRYYSSLGYLPLAGRLSMLSVIDEWVARHGEQDQVWGEVWAWANDLRSPVARYHACAVFVQRPALVPDEAIEQLWCEAAQIICFAQDELRLESAQPWSLLCRLAKHYLSYMECSFPGVDGEGAAAAAWWLSSKVSALFEAPPELTSFFVDEVLDGNQQVSGRIRSVSHPIASSSGLRYATLYLPSIWSLSLLCMAGDSFNDLQPSRANGTEVAEIGAEVVRSALRRFPIHPKPADEAVFGFDLSLVPAGAISDFLDENSDSRRFLEAVRPNHDAEQPERPDGLGVCLEGVSAETPEVQYFSANDLLVRVYTGDASEDVVWEWISADEWPRNVLPKIELTTLSIVLDAVLEMQVRVGGKWAHQLPHVFARTCEHMVKEDQFREFTFGATVISSMASDTASAIIRLLSGKHRHAFHAETEHWRAQMKDLHDVAPPWIASRARAMLASLRIG